MAVAALEAVVAPAAGLSACFSSSAQSTVSEGGDGRAGVAGVAGVGAVEDTANNTSPASGSNGEEVKLSRAMPRIRIGSTPVSDLLPTSAPPYPSNARALWEGLLQTVSPDIDTIFSRKDKKGEKPTLTSGWTLLLTGVVCGHAVAVSSAG